MLSLALSPLTDAALVFARIGTMLMLVPGLGERIVLRQGRLILALFLTLVMVPIVPLDDVPRGSSSGLVRMFFSEMAIGAIFGMTLRVVAAGLEFAGHIIAQSLGLTFAETFDPMQGGQSAVLVQGLVIMGIAALMAADMHHVLIAAMVESYTVFPPAGWSMNEGLAQMILLALARMGAVALGIAAPFVLLGFVVNASLGVISRAMPQLQIYFIGVPLTIMAGMALLAALAATLTTLHVDSLKQFLKLIGF
jgi:flagellar biosynthetic protein FliR